MINVDKIIIILLAMWNVKNGCLSCKKKNLDWWYYERLSFVLYLWGWACHIGGKDGEIVVIQLMLLDGVHHILGDIKLCWWGCKQGQGGVEIIIREEYEIAVVAAFIPVKGATGPEHRS